MLQLVSIWSFARLDKTFVELGLRRRERILVIAFEILRIAELIVTSDSPCELLGKVVYDLGREENYEYETCPSNARNGVW